MNEPAITNFTKLTNFTAFVLILVSSQSFAQIEEVIVTAQKRKQTLQEVPIAVTAFTGEQLREYGFNDLRDLAHQIPNVQIGGLYAGGDKPDIVIRGYGINELFTAFDASPVGVYNDEVYNGSRSGLLSQIYDLERVETLRGPQGTLWGRNTTGGAVHFISRKPDTGADVNGYGRFTAGRFDQLDFEGAIGVPLIKDVLAMRISGIKRDSDGYTKNEFDGSRLNGIDSWAGRVQLSWTPTESMEWLLSINASEKETAGGNHAIGLGNNEPSPITGYVENRDFHTLSNDIVVLSETKKAGITLKGEVDVDWFGGSMLTTITNHQATNYEYSSSFDGTPFNLGNTDALPDQMNQFSQELRLASNNENHLSWTAGFYYYTDEIATETELTLFGFLNLVSDAAQESDNWAVFTDLSYELTNDITLRGGVRYTEEDKDFMIDAGGFFGPTISNFRGSESWSAFTGSVGIDWRLNEDAMIYASYKRGFKSGGFNGGALNDPSEVGPFDPEFVNSYEIGAKTSWFNNRLRVNAAGFYNEISDLQALLPIPPVILLVQNASSADVLGAELEIVATPTDRLSLSLGVGLLDSEFGNFINDSVTVAFPNVTVSRNLKGNEFAAAPGEQVNGSIQYDLPFFADSTLSPRLEFSHIGDHFHWSFNNPLFKEDSYTLLNVKLNWTSANGALRAGFWVNNLTDEEYNVKVTGHFAYVGFLGSATAIRGPDRSYGVTLQYNYD